jgi:hypothetical protein
MNRRALNGRQLGRGNRPHARIKFFSSLFKDSIQRLQTKSGCGKVKRVDNCCLLVCFQIAGS